MNRGGPGDLVDARVVLMRLVLDQGRHLLAGSGFRVKGATFARQRLAKRRDAPAGLGGSSFSLSLSLSLALARCFSLQSRGVVLMRLVLHQRRHLLSI